MRQKEDQRGVSLMEMMVAVAIVALLLIVSMFSLREQLGKGRDSRRKEDINTIKTAVEQYYDDHGCYPAPELVECDSTQLAPYIPVVPCDPINRGSYVYDYADDLCSDYVIYARLEHETDPVISDLGCTVGCGPSGVYNYYVSSAGYDVEKLAAPTGTASPTVTGTVTPTPSGTEVTPLCDGSCIANECGTCCPGMDYRCNATGDGCAYDVTCTNP